MAGRKTTRLEIARRASRLARTDESFRKLLQVEASDGSLPIVAATLDDKVGELFKELDRHHPGGANVIVGDASVSGLYILTCRRDGAAGGQQPVTDCRVHVGSEIGALIALLRLYEGQAVSCLLVGEYEVEAELVPAA